MRRLLLLALLALLGGPSAAEARRGDGVPRNFVRFPIERQETRASCGLASLRSFLEHVQRFAGKERDLRRLARAHGSYAGAYGTEANGLVAIARGAGIRARRQERMTVAMLRHLYDANRRPGAKTVRGVIVEIQAWGTQRRRPYAHPDSDDGHYVLVAGIGKKDVFFMDPSLGEDGRGHPVFQYTRMPIPEFLQRWHGWLNYATGGSRHAYQTGIVLEAPRPSGASFGLTL